MSTRGVILIGGPDTGKTNFIGRFWVALRTAGGTLTASGTPDEIKYVEDTVTYLHQGTFAPRTDKNLEADQGSLTIPLGAGDFDPGDRAQLVVPDISGELWKEAVETNELAPERMAQLENAIGAILFVRVLSPLNVNPPDWVNAAELMEYQGDDAQLGEMPTQVMLCEFLRFIELKLPDLTSDRKARISVIVTAWDLLDPDRSAAGPTAYLQQEYPLFAGRLADLDRLDATTFAMSVFGGDPKADEDFRDELLESGITSAGYVRFDNDGVVEEVCDITLPVAWAIGICDTL